MMFQTVGLILVLAVSHLAVSGWSQQSSKDQAYTNPVYRWSVSYPPDWVLDSQNPASVKIRPLADVPFGLVGIRSIAFSKDRLGLSLDDFITLLISGEARTPGFRILSRTSTTLPGGVPAVEIVNVLGVGTVGKSRKLYAIVDGTGFVINAETYLDSWPAMESYFERIIRSFTPAAPSSTRTPQPAPSSAGSARDLLDRGIEEMRRGNYDEAIANYSKAIDLEPKSALAYALRGDAHVFRGNLDQAIVDSTKAIEIDPRFSPAYIVRGLANRDKGNLDQAIVDYTKAIEIDPKNANAYDARGGAYAIKRNFEQAIADFGKAIEMEPRYAGAYANRGTAYLTSGKLDEAIADYNQAIALNPNGFTNYLSRGNAYRQRGFKPQAIADLETFLRLAPNANVRGQVEQWLRELKGQ